jgi:hypothetical protein
MKEKGTNDGKHRVNVRGVLRITSRDLRIMCSSFLMA